MYHFIFDKNLLKDMFGFAGWNFIGASSSVLRDQGGNVVINLFCGPAVNAARGIAFQVNNAVNGFVVALNPQITKQYAAGNREYMMTLIFQGARLSFYMLLLLSLPILVNTHYVLGLWLKIVPEHAVSFVQLVLVFAMSESISQPLVTAMLATGKIRNYQLVVGGLQMMNLPVSYVLLRMGAVPETVLIVAIAISVRLYLKKVYTNVLMVSFISMAVPILFVSHMDETFLDFVVSCAVTVVCTGFTIYYVGCNRTERTFVVEKIHKIARKQR